MKFLLCLFGVLTLLGFQHLVAQSTNSNWAKMVMSNAITFSTNDSELVMKDSAMKMLYGNTDAEEGSPYNMFKKSQQFMETRLPSKDDAVNINEIYTGAIIASKVNGPNQAPCEDNHGHWQNIGPKSPPNLQNQGMVTAIWSDPTAMVIVIGTQNGGLWRTDDGGVNWQNISDNATGIGTMGIRSMTVNPNVPDAQDIYFTTYVSGAGFFNGGNGYGFGVFHTTDGGQNWTQESGFPFFSTLQNISFNPDNFYASCIKFCPYLINNESYVVLAVQDHLFAKLSSWSSWVDLTPDQTANIRDGISLFQGTPSSSFYMHSSNIHDIEFPDDLGFKGTVVVSNTGWLWTERSAICRQDFATSGVNAGLPIGLPKTLFNAV